MLLEILMRSIVLLTIPETDSEESQNSRSTIIHNGKKQSSRNNSNDTIIYNGNNAYLKSSSSIEEFTDSIDNSTDTIVDLKKEFFEKEYRNRLKEKKDEEERNNNWTRLPDGTVLVDENLNISSSESDIGNSHTDLTHSYTPDKHRSSLCMKGSSIIDKLKNKPKEFEKEKKSTWSNKTKKKKSYKTPKEQRKQIINKVSLSDKKSEYTKKQRGSGFRLPPEKNRYDKTKSILNRPENIGKYTQFCQHNFR